MDREMGVWMLRVIQAARHLGGGGEEAVRLLWEDLLGPLSPVSEPCAGEDEALRSDGKQWCLNIGGRWWRGNAPRERRLRKEKDLLARLQREANTQMGRAAACASAARAAEEMGEQNRMLLRAVAALHHDLGNVLNPVIGRLALLQSNADNLPPEVREDLEAVWSYIPLVQGMASRSKEALAELLGTTGEIETVDLSETVTTLFGGYLERQRALREDLGISVRWDLPAGVRVRLSPAGFFQALWNVLHNALKFTKAGEVDVRVRRGEKGMGWVEVKDTGPGIPAEDRRRLMQGAFGYRGHNAKIAPGSGIGLWATVQLVRGMGGKVVILPVQPHGTVVALGFPLAEETAQALEEA